MYPQAVDVDLSEGPPRDIPSRELRDQNSPLRSQIGSAEHTPLQGPPQGPSHGSLQGPSQGPPQGPSQGPLQGSILSQQSNDMSIGLQSSLSRTRSPEPSLSGMYPFSPIQRSPFPRPVSRSPFRSPLKTPSPLPCSQLVTQISDVRTHDFQATVIQIPLSPLIQDNEGRMVQLSWADREILSERMLSQNNIVTGADSLLDDRLNLIPRLTTPKPITATPNSVSNSPMTQMSPRPLTPLAQRPLTPLSQRSISFDARALSVPSSIVGMEFKFGSTLYSGQLNDESSFNKQWQQAPSVRTLTSTPTTLPKPLFSPRRLSVLPDRSRENMFAKRADAMLKKNDAVLSKEQTTFSKEDSLKQDGEHGSLSVQKGAHGTLSVQKGTQFANPSAVSVTPVPHSPIPADLVQDPIPALQPQQPIAPLQPPTAFLLDKDMMQRCSADKISLEKTAFGKPLVGPTDLQKDLQPPPLTFSGRERSLNLCPKLWGSPRQYKEIFDNFEVFGANLLKNEDEHDKKGMVPDENAERIEVLPGEELQIILSPRDKNSKIEAIYDLVDKAEGFTSLVIQETDEPSKDSTSVVDGKQVGSNLEQVPKLAANTPEDVGTIVWSPTKEKEITNEITNQTVSASTGGKSVLSLVGSSPKSIERVRSPAMKRFGNLVEKRWKSPHGGGRLKSPIVSVKGMQNPLFEGMQTPVSVNSPRDRWCDDCVRRSRSPTPINRARPIVASPLSTFRIGMPKSPRQTESPTTSIVSPVVQQGSPRIEIPTLNFISHEKVHGGTVNQIGSRIPAANQNRIISPAANQTSSSPGPSPPVNRMKDPCLVVNRGQSPVHRLVSERLVSPKTNRLISPMVSPRERSTTGGDEKRTLLFTPLPKPVINFQTAGGSPTSYIASGNPPSSWDPSWENSPTQKNFLKKTEIQSVRSSPLTKNESPSIDDNNKRKPQSGSIKVLITEEKSLVIKKDMRDIHLFKETERRKDSKQANQSLETGDFVGANCETNRLERFESIDQLAESSEGRGIENLNSAFQANPTVQKNTISNESFKDCIDGEEGTVGEENTNGKEPNFSCQRESSTEDDKIKQLSTEDDKNKQLSTEDDKIKQLSTEDDKIKQSNTCIALSNWTASMAESNDDCDNTVVEIRVRSPRTKSTQVYTKKSIYSNAIVLGWKKTKKEETLRYNER